MTSIELAIQVREGLSSLSFWGSVVAIVILGIWMLWDKRNQAKKLEEMYYQAARLGLTPSDLKDMTPNQWKKFRGHAQFAREVQKLMPYGMPTKCLAKNLNL